MRVFYRDGKRYIYTTDEELCLNDPYLGFSKEEHERYLAEEREYEHWLSSNTTQAVFGVAD